MAHVSHKLRNPIQGALAGGGDPASSPLYIFGPFLKLLAAAGLTSVAFGASIWLAIFTIAFVSLMYRSVMKWITDGSGGSGLAEEEYGSWAVKITASITFIEYTLTFLVSMAALVTFAADRFSFLNDDFFIFDNRTLLAIVVSILTAWLVNRGPMAASKVFGPATAGVLIMLWVLIIVVIAKRGIEIPGVNFEAFSKDNIGTTFGAYARILALMTGIEVFANLVGAFEGKPKEKSKKAFQSLMIIMVTAALTMLIVGPAIRDLSDPHDEHVSVFTQTMDALLPSWLSAVGTFIGIAVLLSASAASALGTQNLFVGLKLRHYIPPRLGMINRFGVASRPIWIQTAIATIAFLIVGTHEEKYLALYAAGVFVLLSITGWASTKRLIRYFKESRTTRNVIVLSGTIVASILTTTATVIIFTERFTEGAWAYLILMPVLFLVFTMYRNILGSPSNIELKTATQMQSSISSADVVLWEIESQNVVNEIVVPSDGSESSVKGIEIAELLSEILIANVHKIHITDDDQSSSEIENIPLEGRSIAESINDYADSKMANLIVLGTRESTERKKFAPRAITTALTAISDIPVLIIPQGWNDITRITHPQKLLVALDGSKPSERALSFAANIAKTFSSTITLLYIPNDDSKMLEMKKYLDSIKSFLTTQNIESNILIEGIEPMTSIPEIAIDSNSDMLFITTRGQSTFEKIMTGSITNKIIQQIEIPTVVVPLVEDLLQRKKLIGS